MEVIWRLLYNLLLLPALYFSFHILSLFNQKIAEGIKGRKNLFETLQAQLDSAKSKPQPPKPYTIWFHCSSWEFEQAKTLISNLKDQAQIVVSFFSPSGFESSKNYPHIDALFYLPFDTAKNAKRLISLISPSMIIFVKFDIWPNLVWQAKRSKVPIAVVAGTLHVKSKRLWPIAKSFFKSVHRHIQLYCAISEPDAKRYQLIAPKNSKIHITGDTRYDQVYQSAASLRADEILIPGQQKIGSHSIVAGSTHLEDEKVLLKAFQKLRNFKVSLNLINLKLILVPHETDLKRLQQIENLLSQNSLSYLRFSNLNSEADIDKSEVILIDRIGMLAKLYKIGSLAFVGGSFYGSVHNVMEPAVLSKPVIFGPYIHNSYEAIQLVQLGAGIIVKNDAEMANTIGRLMTNPQLCYQMGSLGRSLIEKNLGATEKTLTQLRRVLNA